jgi:hypothetical protein
MKKTASIEQRRQSVEQRLYRHWREFLDLSHQSLDRDDEATLEAAREKFRAQVAKAAAAGVECSVTWFSLGLWSFDNDERIRCFGRTLTCMTEEERRSPATDDLGRWTYAHYNALCRFELARSFANEGHRKEAKTLLAEALPYARAAEDMPVRGEAFEGNLEGRIAGELLLLDVQL